MTTGDRGAGARFYKCALQVNPFAYLVTNNKRHPFDDEETFNAAMAQACVDQDIAVVGLTDHHRVQGSLGLAQVLTDVGVTVLPGFEATTSDGVHVLILFAEGTPPEEINRRIGEHGVDYTDGNSRLGTHDTSELLAKASVWGAMAIPAHIEVADGLLTTGSGQARAAAWTSPDLLAVGTTKPTDELSEGHQAILDCSPAEYRRDHPPSIVMAKDVYGPTDLARLGTWTWLKMTTPGFAGVRQAFLDTESRVVLPPDDPTHAGPRIASVSWQGGFLDGVEIRLNDHFNAVIGGRGTGKSTVIESIRFALDLPELRPADRTAFHQTVLRPGTMVTVQVEDGGPRAMPYTIRRAVGGAPEVSTNSGRSPINPDEVLPHLDLFGQRDLAALADDAAGRDRLLRRFMPPDPQADARRAALKEELASNRVLILAMDSRRVELESEVDRIPLVESQLARLQDVALDERLERKTRLAKDGRVIDRADRDVLDAIDAVSAAQAALDLDLAYLSAPARKDAEAQDELEGAEHSLTQLTQDVVQPLAVLQEAVQRARDEVRRQRAAVTRKEQAADEDYQAALRDLAVGGIDASRYVDLDRELDRLRQLDGQLGQVMTSLTVARTHRNELLSERRVLLDAIHARRKTAARQMRRRLARRVEVTPRSSVDRDAVIAVLDRCLSGRLDKVRAAITDTADFELQVFLDAVAGGPQAIRLLLPDVTSTQAQTLAGCPLEALLELQELNPVEEVAVHLNLSSDGEQWQPVEDLSTGQKATAMLLMALLDGDQPLIIDQPEDDLDNEFISTALVPLIRNTKAGRQLLLSTHNANIPVLGDAELLIVMEAEGSASSGGHGRVARGGYGSIDDASVRGHVERILEGGKMAFETRRRRYGY